MAYIRKPYIPLHTPVQPSTRPKCPVCKQAAFSLGGIHPQCSLEREEAERMIVAKAMRAAESPGEIPAKKASSWRQPRCRPPGE